MAIHAWLTMAGGDVTKCNDAFGRGGAGRGQVLRKG